MAPRGKKAARWILPVVGLAIEAVLIVVLAVKLPKPVPEVVSGTVKCQSGLPVVGIWLEAQRGGSTWVGFDPLGAELSTVRYEYQLPNGGPYELRVGCGGTIARWASTSYTGFVHGSGFAFICADDPKGSNGRCRTGRAP
jgi:hypothetical protein